jgi:hypothetical protein
MDQLTTLLIVQEGFCEAVIDNESVTRGIAPVVNNLASAKTTHVHVRNEFSALFLGERENRQDVPQLIGHVPDGVEVHRPHILGWPVQQRKQGEFASGARRHFALV